MAQEITMILPASGTPPDMQSGSVYFIGTATVLIRYAGFTILTDPNFLHKGHKVRLGYGLSSVRRTNPAINIEQLPPLDLVVLSHMHEDHFDRLVEEKLAKDVPIVSTKHATAALKKAGFTATRTLDMWDALVVTKGDAQLRLTAMPGHHGPGIMDKMLPPVMGSMLEFSVGGKVLYRMYITGDMLIHEDLREIPRKYPDIDLALLHLGGTKAFGLLVTMDDKQGVQALRLVKPRLAIPIHFNDYTIFKSPLSDFVKAVKDAGLQSKVKYLKHGDTHTFQGRT